MYGRITRHENHVEIEGIERLDLSRACACGQTFRWQPCQDGFFGVIYGTGVLAQQRDGVLCVMSAEPMSDERIIDYFDLRRDYAEIEAAIQKNPRIGACVPYASGIRVFNQEPFETLISFIISANNNVKRISGIVERLCAYAGERKHFLGREYFTFPTPERIAGLSVPELTSLGTGYRAPYIKKSAEIVAEGYDLLSLRNMPLDAARKEIMRFPGVGPKVADCVLLFALGHADAFPVDVWINRAMSEMFFDGEKPDPAELRAAILSLGALSGIAQQYIFHYIRERGTILPK